MIAPIGSLGLSIGGPVPACFSEIWMADFEYSISDGEHPRVQCLVAKEFHSGREIRLWADELARLKQAPFDTGPNSLFVAYYIPAEMGCFIKLGWDIPQYALDLYVEHRVQTNGLIPKGKKNRLPDALECRGLPHLDVAEKDEMISLILSKDVFSPQEQQAILDYCASDVYGLEDLLPVMVTQGIDWPRALFRGHYMKATAWVVHFGIPIDTHALHQLQDNWDWLRHSLIKSLPADFDAYQDGHFSSANFLGWCDRQGIPWPRLPSGAPILRKKVLEDLKDIHPTLRQLHEIRSSLGEMRMADLAIGSDGCNRTLLGQFGTVTSRNTPSNSKSVFGPATWMRGLIKPDEGEAIAYLDYSSQENAISAAVSDDANMAEDYASGDPYLAFAIANGLAPANATKNTHEAIRDVCKVCVLGVSYGMEFQSMAIRAGVQPQVARTILQRHRDRYRTFWQWAQTTKDQAQMSGTMSTCLGWKRHLKAYEAFQPRSVQNWPIQSCGAEIMRIVVVLAIDAGLRLCMPVHDGFVVSSTPERIESDVAKMRAIMNWAGQLVTGMEIRIDCKIVRWPDRYMDKRGKRMWDHIFGLLHQRQMAA
jgi:DNA polymerase I